MIGVEIWKLDYQCYRCDAPMEVVYPNGVGGFAGDWVEVGPELTDKEYCNVEKTHSKTQGRDVYGNICENCGAYQGNHFVYEAVFSGVAAVQSWDAQDIPGIEVVDVIEISWPCKECGRELTEKKEPPICGECAFELEVESSLGESTELQFCPICDGIVPPGNWADHHTSYERDETISVCNVCHAKIHHKDGFRDDLLPDMSRAEAKTNGFI